MLGSFSSAQELLVMNGISEDDGREDYFENGVICGNPIFHFSLDVGTWESRLDQLSIFPIKASSCSEGKEKVRRVSCLIPHDSQTIVG